MLIIVGLPASGKTTIANIFKHLIERKYENFQVKIVDPDLIRKTISPNDFNPKKEQLVRKQNLKAVKRGLNEGFIVISDDLNYYTSMRHDLKQIAEKNKSNYFIIHVDTPLRKCIEWNENRGKFIPNDVIYKVKDKLDKFDNYKWDHPILTIDPSKSDNLEEDLEKLINLIEKNLNLQSLIASYKRKRTDKTQYHEKLDSLTRKIIANIANNEKNLRYIKEILNLRKEFIKTHLKKSLSDTEISEEFLKFITRHLNIETS